MSAVFIFFCSQPVCCILRVDALLMLFGSRSSCEGTSYHDHCVTSVADCCQQTEERSGKRKKEAANEERSGKRRTKRQTRKEEAYKKRQKKAKKKHKAKSKKQKKQKKKKQKKKKRRRRRRRKNEKNLIRKKFRVQVHKPASGKGLRVYIFDSKQLVRV